ncbi:hypothetical protein Y032_0322g2449 [Ancylostoma ceylanicum]|uniref:Globin family profile domain-containing protein n=1 Tax=Ancylostoma ceylanicum TaxID=53326 RepID=A0A016S1E7_9BILA|nr:hypothetical protein Y032_0322g2449 [Ancylostoma ceylanicum]
MWSYEKRLDEPKEIVGIIFVDIVNDIEPDLKKVFGVDRAPKAAMLKMPKFGGHVARFTDLIDQTTSMLGFTENLSGAWQIVRKTGRIHVKQGFLEQNQNQLEKNYFEVVMNIFIERFIPFLTGEQIYTYGGEDKEKCWASDSCKGHWEFGFVCKRSLMKEETKKPTELEKL